MTALAASHGSVADFYIGTSGSPGTPVQISQYLNDVTFGINRDKAETSAFKAMFKSYVAGLCDLTIPLAGTADTNISGQLYNLLIMVGAGNAIEYQYAPVGLGTTGTPLYTGFGFLTKYEEKTAINSAWTFTAEFQSSSITGPTRTIQ